MRTWEASSVGISRYVARYSCRHQARRPSTSEFIPIKPSVATGSDGPGSYAGHSRCPSRPYGREHATSGNKLSIVFFDKRLVAHCTVDDRSTEFPKKSSTGNFPPDILHKSASSG